MGMCAPHWCLCILHMSKVGQSHIYTVHSKYPLSTISLWHLVQKVIKTLYTLFLAGNSPEIRCIYIRLWPTLHMSYKILHTFPVSHCERPTVGCTSSSLPPHQQQRAVLPTSPGYTQIHTNTHTQTHTHTHHGSFAQEVLAKLHSFSACTFTHACTCAHIHIHTQTHLESAVDGVLIVLHTYTHIYTYTHKRTLIALWMAYWSYYTHTHIYTYTNIHTQTHLDSAVDGVLIVLPVQCLVHSCARSTGV